MTPEGPVSAPAAAFERVLRTLPRWFGLEASLLTYAADTQRWPTFATRADDGRVVAFMTVQQHFGAAWELHCIAVEAPLRRHGLGGALHAHVEAWLRERGGQLLQVKTLAASHPDPEYTETREFYEHIGYLPHELFADFGEAHLPLLQLVKTLRR